MDRLSIDFEVVSVEWRVLIAAPLAIHRRHIREIVARYPMRIHIAEIGEGADIRPALASNAYDVAFIDVGFAELHGLTALHDARLQGSRTFVTLVADKVDNDLIDIAKAVRAYDYLSRPLNSMVVFKTLDNYAQMSRPLKVLIIDHSPERRQLVREAMDHSVFRTDILEAADGVTGFELYAKYGPDVVFLDFSLPGLGGRDTWRMLRAHNNHARVVVMIDDPSQAEHFEHVQCLTKPLCAEKVDSVMHKLLGLAEPFSC